MNHFNPILNKYNTVKKKLKAKVTERKELNVEKEKTSTYYFMSVLWRADEILFFCST